MSANFEIYLASGPTQTLLNDIGHCRIPECPIVQKQPFYPTPNDPPLYLGNRPCNPVVPTHTAPRKIMFIGQFPNCRFATVTAPDNTDECFVAVADINEPFESGRYFDGRSIREYPTARSLHEYYWKPLGLDLTNDLWLTNLVKCFTMDDGDIDSYQKLGWSQLGDPQPQATSNQYFEIAEICGRNWLKQEIELCDPTLIIAVGERSYRMIHGEDDFGGPGPDIRFGDVVGVPMPANGDGGPLDNRFPLFKERNVIHLSHPSSFLYQNSEARREKHLLTHIPNTLQFMDDLGLLVANPKYQIFQGIDQQYYFRLKAENGEIILASEGYTARSSCENGVQSVRTNSPFEQRYRRLAASNGQPYFTLTAANGQVIGRSELYTTESSRDAGIAAVQQLGPGGTVEILA